MKPPPLTPPVDGICSICACHVKIINDVATVYCPHNLCGALVALNMPRLVWSMTAPIDQATWDFGMQQIGSAFSLPGKSTH